MTTPNFDRIARLYRWAEYLTLGPLLQRTRTHFLPQLAHCRRALVLGDGDGRFLARLLQQNPGLQAVAVDTSAAMLRLLKQRNPTAQTVQLDALSYSGALASGLIVNEERSGASTPDLIVTHFFLDCLTQPELDQLTLNLAAPTRPGTLWLLSDFAVPTHPVLGPIGAVYIRALYLAFRILTGLRVTHLPDPHAALTHAGFSRLARHQRLGGLLYTELWQRK
jgi:SAM-dependent methyltransferase